MARNTIGAIGAVALAALLGIGSASADAIEDFYKGKSVTVTIGTEAGGGYDQYARTLSRHMGRFIPGQPTFIAKNVPGADGLQATSRLYSIAPKDGTEIGTFHRDIPVLPLLGLVKIDYDPTKFGWIGSMNEETTICMSWHTSPVKKFEDTFTNQLIVGVTAAGATLDTFEAPLINLFGAKLKVVAGYRGGQNIDLAMERGEIDGRCGVSWSSLVVRNADWFKDKKINILLQLGLDKHPDLKDVPMVQELVTSQQDKDALNLLLIPGLIGRPYLTPPDLPKERLAALRQAFDATLKDPQFLADAQKQRMEVQLVPGEQVDRVVRAAYEAPKPVLDRAKELMKGSIQ
jgi:tripartite-type tricarboxylate transporter receptor subunit TctC